MNEQAKAAKAAYMKSYREKEENKQKANEYMRKWRMNNKERVALYNEKYWSKQAAVLNG